jgi:hypothetical protein
MRVFIALLSLALLAVPCPGPFQVGPKSAPDGAEDSYASPDGAFQFDFPNLLVRCHRSADGAWEPHQSCQAMPAVCEEGDVACFAYPAERLAGLNLVAAAFSVGRSQQAGSEMECFKTPDEPNPASKDRIQTFHNVKFSVDQDTDAAMGHSRQSYAFRTYHGGNCYAMGITYSYVNPGVFDPEDAPKELTKEQLAGIDKLLRRPLMTFRFVH